MRRPESRQSQIRRFGELLDRYLGRPAPLLDALHAMAILGEEDGAPSLTELVLDHLRSDGGTGRPASSITLGELFARRGERYRPEQVRSARSLRTSERFFRRAFGGDVPVESLSPDRIGAALDACASPNTANSHLRRLRLAVNWGLRSRLLSRSPLEGVAPRRVAWKEPAFFPPERVERIMRTAEAHPGPLRGAVGAWLALGFFCGVRTAEILRASWEDVDLEAGTLRIPRPKGFSNGARPRLVELEPNAAAWLRRWRDWAARSGAPPAGRIVLEPHRLKRWKREHLAPTGDSWGNDGAHNVMRHTYATMHVGAFRDAEATALNLGHRRGTDLLDRHYRGLVPRTVAETYWRIRPSDSLPPPPEPVPGRGFRSDRPRTADPDPL
jgi:integrase